MIHTDCVSCGSSDTEWIGTEKVKCNECEYTQTITYVDSIPCPECESMLTSYNINTDGYFCWNCGYSWAHQTYKIREDLSKKINDDVTVYRIEALENIPAQNVKKGDIGGYIQGSFNLLGWAWVFDDACVYEDAVVRNYAAVKEKAKVFGQAEVYDEAVVQGSAKVYGNAKIRKHVSVYDNVEVCGDVYIGFPVSGPTNDSYAKVYGNAKISGNVFIYGNAKIYENAVCRGHFLKYIHGDAEVYGDAQLLGDVSMYENAKIYGNATVYEGSISGDAEIYENAIIGLKYKRNYLNTANHPPKINIISSPSILGSSKIHGNARIESGNIRENAEIYDNALIRAPSVYGDSKIYGNVHIYGGFIYGNAHVYGNATIMSEYDDMFIYGNARIYGNAFIGADDTHICGNATICGNAFVTRTYSYRLYIQGNAYIGGNSFWGIDTSVGVKNNTQDGMVLEKENSCINYIFDNRSVTLVEKTQSYRNTYGMYIVGTAAQNDYYVNRPDMYKTCYEWLWMTPHHLTDLSSSRSWSYNDYNFFMWFKKWRPKLIELSKPYLTEEELKQINAVTKEYWTEPE